MRVDFGDLEGKLKTLLAAPAELQALADAAHKTLTVHSTADAFAADVAAMLRDIEVPASGGAPASGDPPGSRGVTDGDDTPASPLALSHRLTS